MTFSAAATLGLHEVRLVPGGHQSLGVYAARYEGIPGSRQVVVKLVDARHVDLEVLTTRVGMSAQLGAIDGAVCRPVDLAGRLVNQVQLDDGAGLAYAVAYELAEGDPPDIARPDHATVMGRTLAGMHASMRALPRFDLPRLAAFPPRSGLAGVAAELGVALDCLPDVAEGGDLGPGQLLHGDFNGTNVRIDGPTGRHSVRVFDFDDCGYGPVELDVALALYMVLFGTTTGSTPVAYTTFRTGFLGAYRARAAVDLPDATLDGLITLRVLALASWLQHPETAPAGIRTASADWRRSLRRFVDDYLDLTCRQ